MGLGFRACRYTVAHANTWVWVPHWEWTESVVHTVAVACVVLAGAHIMVAVWLSCKRVCSAATAGAQGSRGARMQQQGSKGQRTAAKGAVAGSSSKGERERRTVAGATTLRVQGVCCTAALGSVSVEML